MSRYPFEARAGEFHATVTDPFVALLVRSPTVIGKAGAKINEIRSASQTQIRIMEPGQPGASANTDERLVTITGQPTGINMAIQLLYQVSHPPRPHSCLETRPLTPSCLLSLSQRLEQEKAARLQSA